MLTGPIPILPQGLGQVALPHTLWYTWPRQLEADGYGSRAPVLPGSAPGLAVSIIPALEAFDKHKGLHPRKL
jgi:hypothetical protein